MAGVWLLRTRLPGRQLPTFADAGFAVAVTDVTVAALIAYTDGDVTADLFSPNGEHVAGARLSPPPSGDAYANGTFDGQARTWVAGTLEDEEGEAIAVSAGDRLVVRPAGGQAAAALVPPMSIRVSRLDGRIDGTTGAGADVSVTIGAMPGPGAAQGTSERGAAGQADSSGAFTVVVAPPGPIIAGAPMTLTVATGSGLGRTVVRSVPHVRASMMPGDVSGNMAPDAQIEVNLTDSGDWPRAVASARTDQAGRYTVWLRDLRGELVRPVPGDVVRVTDGADTLTLRISPLSGVYVDDKKRITGEAEPGSTVAALAWNPWWPGDMTPLVSVGSSGTWRLDLEDGLQPASHYYLTETVTSGDEITLCLQRPFVQLTPGTAAVTVEALWDTEATLQLARSGKPVAWAKGGATWSGDAALLWKAASGQLMDAQPGDQVTGVVNGWPVNFMVGDLEAHIDPETGSIQGRAPPGAEVFLGWRAPWEEVAVDSDGTFRFDVRERLEGGAVAPGTTMEVGYAAPEGHHIRKVFAGVSVSASLTTGAITGAAQPGSPIEIRLLAADGTPKAVVTTIADPHGRIRTTLPPSGPLPEPGDRLELSGDAGATTIAVPSFAASFDASTGIVAGTAPPHGLVNLSVFIGTSLNPETRHGFVGEDGTWSIDLRRGGLGQGMLDPSAVRSIHVSLGLDSNRVTRSLAVGP